jgi:hypothetical protein
LPVLKIPDERDCGKGMFNGVEVAEQGVLDAARLAQKKARERANATMWSLEVVVLSFAILIVVIILLFQQIQFEYVAAFAITGLVVVWMLGRRRGKQLFLSFYEEELLRLGEEEKKKEEEEETIEDKVRRALQDRWR